MLNCFLLIKRDILKINKKKNSFSIISNQVVNYLSKDTILFMFKDLKVINILFYHKTLKAKPLSSNMASV